MSTCTEPACDEAAHARGLCWRHYQQERRGRLRETPLRAARGAGGQVVFRLSEPQRLLVAELARREEIEPSEWYRRAVAERVERQTTADH